MKNQGGAGGMRETVDSGSFPLYQADTRKMAVDKAYALRRGMAILGRRF